MKIWNVATGVLESTLDHKEGVATVSFSSDGTQLWTGTKDRRIHEWTWASTGHDTAIIATSAFSKDGQHVASSLGGDAVRLWDTDSGNPRRILLGHSATIESVSFSPVGDFVAIGSSDKMARIWDAVTGTCLFQLEGHSGIVTSVVFSPDGTQVATSSLDQTLRWWNLSVPESESLPKEGGGTLVSQSEQHAMVPISAMQIDKEETSTQGTHGAAVGIYTHDDSGLFHAPVYSPDGSEISVISGQHGVLRFDTRSKAPLPALSIQWKNLARGGLVLVTGCKENPLRVWEVVNVKRRQYEVRRYWGAGVESLAVSDTRLGQEHGLTEADCKLLG
ncbi:WD40-repeat-containing domain protein [Linnemannia elongata]|nr:WD40-repeat-containing domain protein [Linnemannia elongata]